MKNFCLTSRRRGVRKTFGFRTRGRERTDEDDVHSAEILATDISMHSLVRGRPHAIDDDRNCSP
eukprot:31070-Pelagococcus_subviridis.AAC.5